MSSAQGPWCKLHLPATAGGDSRRIRLRGLLHSGHQHNSHGMKPLTFFALLFFCLVGGFSLTLLLSKYKIEDDPRPLKTIYHDNHKFISYKNNANVLVHHPDCHCWK